jgi:transposase
MAMGKRRSRQRGLWISQQDLAKSPGHPFYERLNRLLDEHGFDAFSESQCERFYATKMGRPSLPPGIYFRLLLVGYFEGIDSERGICWRVADSIALRQFLGFGLTEATPNHSTISKTRRLIDLESHEAVFGWILQVLAQCGLVKGKTLGIDATTLEANAAMRSIVRRDTGASYEDFLTSLAQASGIETPTRADLAKIDRKRKKKGSNDDWEHPHDPDARITKMKDGRTHLAHKMEHTVDLETGAVLALTIQPADRGDCQSLEHTLDETFMVFDDILAEPKAAAQLSPLFLTEIVADKGYHSNDVLVQLTQQDMRAYISEPKRGRRRWKGKQQARAAVYANRRRIRGDRGLQLLRKRGEFLERPFAHALETGAMRRVFLRGSENIRKRALVHVGGLNLGILMRKVLGAGTPRGLQGRLAAVLALLRHHLRPILRLLKGPIAPSTPFQPVSQLIKLWTVRNTKESIGPGEFTLSTGC